MGGAAATCAPCRGRLLLTHLGGENDPSGPSDSIKGAGGFLWPRWVPLGGVRGPRLRVGPGRKAVKEHGRSAFVDLTQAVGYRTTVPGVAWLVVALSLILIGLKMPFRAADLAKPAMETTASRASLASAATHTSLMTAESHTSLRPGDDPYASLRSRVSWADESQSTAGQGVTGWLRPSLAQALDQEEEQAEETTRNALSALSRTASSRTLRTLASFDGAVARDVVSTPEPASREDDAAVTMQRVARGWLARRDFLNRLINKAVADDEARAARELKRADESLTLLDTLALQRDLDDQRSLRQRREMSDAHAAVVIQRAVRAWLVRRAAMPVLTAVIVEEDDEDDPYVFVPSCRMSRNTSGVRSSSSGKWT